MGRLNRAAFRSGRISRWTAVWSATAILATALAAPTALAVGPEPDTAAGRAAGERAVEEWEARNTWQYGTDQIFSLSRGLEENGVSGGARIAALFATVPLDLAQLPAALIAGLWGN